MSVHDRIDAEEGAGGDAARPSDAVRAASPGAPQASSMAASAAISADMGAHGNVELRGLNTPRSTFYDQGKFGRLFPMLPPLRVSALVLRELGRPGGRMETTAADGSDNPDNPDISAGFTFLGQFLDHDLTFDPTSSLERQQDPESIRNFRTPVLELDSVYGAGPGANPHLYDRSTGNTKFLIGLDFPNPDDAAGAREPNDLPRNPQSVALIGDPRNDENQIVSQLHLAFLKFHNAVVDEVAKRPPVGRSIFEEAQRLVRWHYQWIVLHEFLPLIVGGDMVRDILRDGRRFYQWRNAPYIPVEWAVAAYRFGHTMVRPGYRLSATFARGLFVDGPPATEIPPIPPGEPVDLRGGSHILRKQKMEWGNFFAGASGSNPLQPSKQLDTKLSTALFRLPGPQGSPADPKSLAERNLLRGVTFGLPSGQAVARAMRETPLTPDELEDVKDLILDEETPLWFYVLREAQVRGSGKRLGPVGGRIVAEVFHGILDGDPLSFLNQDPLWKPTLGSGGDFKVLDLLKFAGVSS